MRSSFLKNLCEGKCTLSKTESILESYGFHVMVYFGTLYKKNIANYVLCINDERQHVLFEIDEKKVSECMELEEVSSKLVDEKIRIAFRDQSVRCKVDTVFITDRGVEFLEKSKTYIFSHKDEDMTKLRYLGYDFFHSAPVVKFNDLKTSETSKYSKSLSSILDHPDVSLFKKLLSMSENPSILTYDGPYTIYIPTNNMIEFKYGKNAINITGSDNYYELNSFVLSYIVPGLHKKSSSNNMTTLEVLNVLGDEVVIKNGILHINDSPVNVKNEIFKGRNGYAYIIESKNYLKPTIDQIPKINTKIDEFISFEELEECIKSNKDVTIKLFKSMRNELVEDLKFVERSLSRIDKSEDVLQAGRVFTVKSNMNKIIRSLRDN